MLQKSLCLLLLPIVLLLGGCGAGETDGIEAQTPQYEILPVPEIDFYSLDDTAIHTSEDGVAIVNPDSPDTDAPATLPAAPDLTPETIWQEDETVTYHAFTLSDRAALQEDGCVGILTIPAIDLTMKVYETEDEMEDMLHGGAHYKSTSAWDGNVGISAHVSGVPAECSFENLHRLKAGDTVSYTTALGVREYAVETVAEIAADDWSYLGRTPDNRITMTTCITGQPDKRLLVQACQPEGEWQ